MSIDRNTKIDLLGGVMMMHIIILHASSYIYNGDIETSWMLFPKLTFFAMPFFFYKAGLYYHYEGDKNIKLRKTFRNCVVPYILFMAISNLLYFVVYKRFDINACISSFTQGGFAPWNWALWFFMPFILIKYLSILFDISRHSLLIGIASGMIAYLLYALSIEGLPWFCENVFLGLSYFSMGVFATSHKIQTNRKIQMLGLFIVGVYMLCPSWLGMPDNRMAYGNWIIGYLGAAAGCYFVFKYSKILPQCKPLEFMGRNTLPIFATNYNLILITSKFIHRFNLSLEEKCTILILIEIAAVPVCVYLYNKLCFIFNNDSLI